MVKVVMRRLISLLFLAATFAPNVSALTSETHQILTFIAAR